MTTVKFNGVPFGRALTGLVDDFLTEMPGILKSDVAKSGFRGFAPANISETENAYTIDIAASGFEKTDFKLNLEANILTISAEKKEETPENEKSIRKEFQTRSFKRTFTIDNLIDADKIEAKYVNGILKLTLNKKEEAKASSKDIEIH